MFPQQPGATRFSNDQREASRVKLPLVSTVLTKRECFMREWRIGSAFCPNERLEGETDTLELWSNSCCMIGGTACVPFLAVFGLPGSTDKCCWHTTGEHRRYETASFGIPRNPVASTQRSDESCRLAAGLTGRTLAKSRFKCASTPRRRHFERSWPGTFRRISGLPRQTPPRPPQGHHPRLIGLAMARGVAAKSDITTSARPSIIAISLSGAS
jgi:hypothetical protein